MESRFRCEPDEDGSYPCSVRLAVSDWIGSFINVYVAKIFIEEFLGYPVEITADSSDYTGTVKESDVYAENGTLVEPSGWRLLESGDVDVILEYWPSGHRDNIREFVVERGTVKTAGENGIEGRIGWFMPSFVGEENDPALDYWRTLTDPAKASLFPHPAATTPCCRSDMVQGANAPCVPTEALGGTKVADGGMANAMDECDAVSATAWHEIPTTGGRFLGAQPTWTHHDDQIIRNLGLPLTLVFAGSEEKILEEIETAHTSRTPLLFYFWKPHGAFRMYDFDDFLLPLSSAECRSAQETGDADCGYPIELLAKAYSVSLEQSKPDVAHFVGAMVFNSTVQQEEIHYELLVNSSRTLNEAACEWVKINEHTWTDWTESVVRQYEGEVWQDEVLEPTVVACDCKPDGLRDVVAVYDTSAYAEDGSVIIEVDPSPCSEARNVSLYKTRWSTMLLETEVLKEIQCAHVPLGSSGEIIILTLASIAWLVLLICLVFVVAYRNHKAVKSARIRTLMILLFGAALMNGAETSQIGEPTRLSDPLMYSCAKDEANCCFDADWEKKAAFRCEPDEDGTYPCSIKISISAWAGSFVNVYLAKIFIEEFLGYPVEITANYTDFSGTVAEQSTNTTPGVWELMASGEIDANLEYWPSGHEANVQEYVIDQGVAVAAGQNGLEGRIGWYIPSYMLDTDPSLEYWRELGAQSSLFDDAATTRPCCMKDIEDQDESLLPCMASVEYGGSSTDYGNFNTSESCTDPATQSVTVNPKPRFLAAVEDYSQHDAQIIKNLGLDFSVQFSGSEENSVQAALDADENETPLLMYFWAPHGLFQMANYTYVLLPISTPECVEAEASGNADCGYPTDLLAKAYSTAFEESKPDAAQFITAMQYENNTQQEIMLAALMGESPPSLLNVTCDWVKTYTSTWETWTSAVETQFANQTWKDEDLEPTYVACPCNADATRDVVEIYSTSEYIDDGYVTIDVDPSPCTSERSYSTYRTRWTTRELPTEVYEVIDCAYVPEASVERSVIIALAGAAVGINILCMLGAFIFRNHAAVRTARQKTLIIMLVGGSLLNIAGIFEIGVPTSYKCGLRFSFMLFGFFNFVGTLLVKQFTIVSLMNSKYIMDNRQTQQATFFLRYELVSAFLFCGLWLIIWTFVVGFDPVAEQASTSVDVEEYVCPTNTPLLMLIIALCYITVVISCLLANQTRNFKGLIFREAKFMLFSNYNVAILTAFCLFVVFTDGISPTLKSLFVSVCVFFCTVTCALLVVGTRVYAAYRNLPTDKIMDTSSLVGGSMVGSSEHSSHGVRAGVAL
ncbi:Metabotropic glutamate receptor-like protein B [Hondaea fermentalgiana]|uniref:Metabotropic glutamate receptor-like protein B n=1 Tax=Hondaea fermentalgiana TaxID=2315210 RepID=A0A2R5GS98_9STRA|nr:Metabotropic glutamate receptor-like protein B [Hondaea fermentalgiana]|eukprot:GBG33756.1 Metabotropic glutamate receptor-like protein B [Hondaea fermentalgiana]